MSETDYDLDLSEMGVPRGEGESWSDVAGRRRDRGREWYRCVCGARYRGRRPALRCCGDRFD